MNKFLNAVKAVTGKLRLWRGLAALFGLLLAIFLVLTNLGYRYQGFVNDRLGVTPPTVDAGGEVVYKSQFGELNAENNEKLIEAENDFNIRAMQEGAVMVRNEGDALPLAKDELSVTLFGNSVKNPVYATNGGGSTFKASRGGGLLDAFKSAGFDINMTMYNAYLTSDADRVSSPTPGQSDIGEVVLEGRVDVFLSFDVVAGGFLNKERID